MNNRTDRRTFIKDTLLVAVSVSLPAFGSCRDNNPEPAPGNDPCITTADILGPFYKEGAPLREHMIPAGNKGAPLRIQGRVISDCNSALNNALVEIWNADDKGEYDMSEDFRFRASYRTVTDGTYSFVTIVPGRYLNGSTFRPSHIHFRITAPDHRELISQIYFKDDPYIENDPWAGSENASERILTLTKDVNGTDTVTFDIHLKPA